MEPMYSRKKTGFRRNGTSWPSCACRLALRFMIYLSPGLRRFTSKLGSRRCTAIWRLSKRRRLNIIYRLHRPKQSIKLRVFDRKPERFAVLCAKLTVQSALPRGEISRYRILYEARKIWQIIPSRQFPRSPRIYCRRYTAETPLA